MKHKVYFWIEKFYIISSEIAKRVIRLKNKDKYITVTQACKEVSQRPITSFPFSYKQALLLFCRNLKSDYRKTDYGKLVATLFDYYDKYSSEKGQPKNIEEKKAAVVEILAQPITFYFSPLTVSDMYYGYIKKRHIESVFKKKTKTKWENAKESSKALLNDFSVVLYKVLAKQPDITIREAAKIAANLPAPRFYESPGNVQRYVSLIDRGVPLTLKNKLKIEMYHELHRRYLEHKKEGKYLYEIIYEIISEPAPRFYLNPETLICSFYRYQRTF